MKEVELEAYGKLNLALNITGKRGEMHLIESPAVRVNAADRVIVKRAEFSSIEYSVGGIGKGGVEKALDLLYEAGYGRFDVRIKKNLPIAGGMGGSSADAAALLKAAQIMFEIDDETLFDMAKKSGSDVPFMLFLSAGIISGTGDILTKIDPISLFFVAARFGKGVGSAECYRKYDESGSEKKTCDIGKFLAAVRKGDLKAADSLAFNALTGSAIALSNDIAATIRAIEKAGAVAHLSGSGNTVFCLCKEADEGERIAASIDEKFEPIVLNSVNCAFKLI